LDQAEALQCLYCCFILGNKQCSSAIVIHLIKPAHNKISALVQLCPTRGPHAAQTKVLCGPVQVFAVV